MADQYDDLGHAELDELLEPAELSKSGNLDEKRARLRDYDAEQAAAEESVRHPQKPDYVLQDGQWVLSPEPEPVPPPVVYDPSIGEEE
jgi:hypothetical protein